MTKTERMKLLKELDRLLLDMYNHLDVENYKAEEVWQRAVNIVEELRADRPTRLGVGK